MKIGHIFNEGDVVNFPSSKIKMELDRLLNTKIHGTFSKDEALWNGLEDFIMDDKNPMSYRIKALKKLDQVIGEVQSSYSAKDVNEYVKTTKQERRDMYESEDQKYANAKERIKRAVNIFTHIMQDTPDTNIENAINAAAKLANIERGGELDHVEKECKEVLKLLKRKEK